MTNNIIAAGTCKIKRKESTSAMGERILLQDLANIAGCTPEEYKKRWYEKPSEKNNIIVMTCPNEGINIQRVYMFPINYSLEVAQCFNVLNVHKENILNYLSDLGVTNISLKYLEQ